MTEAQAASRGRGRPRDVSIDASIHAATWRMLADQGYDALTFEAVAEAAGCTRATLYRRYAGKIDLVRAALYAMSMETEPDLSDGASPREALLRNAEGTVIFMSGERGRAILSLNEAGVRHADLRAVSDQFKGHGREYYFNLFRQIHPDADEDRMAFAFDSYIGLMLQHVIMVGAPLNRDRLELIIDAVIGMIVVP